LICSFVCNRSSSPFIAQNALNDIAGTGSARHRYFVVSRVEDCHTRWRNYFLPLVVQRSRLTAANYDQFPAFEFEDEPLSAIVSRAGIGFLLLFAAASVLGMLGYRRLDSYPVAG
jgi:hypothetical protein